MLQSLQRRRAAPASPVSTMPIPIRAKPPRPIAQRKAGCSCGGGCPTCMAEKLSGPDHPAEREAEAVAGKVMSMAASEAAPLVQPNADDMPMRMMEPDEDDDTLQLMAEEDEEEHIQAYAEPGGTKAAKGNPMAGLGGGQPLPAPVRAFFEPRFGRSFADVRIYDGAVASDRARSIYSQAFTYGRNIVFNRGRYSPDTKRGRHLLAHELTHVVQQREHASDQQAAIQRFATCESAEDCPDRERGERARSRSQPMVLNEVVSGALGRLLSNFSVGDGAVHGDLTTVPGWNDFVAAMAANPNRTWTILGVTDCQGSEELNTQLRVERATSLYLALPPDARARVNGYGGAATSNCINDNTTEENRILNRSALIKLASESLDFEPEHVVGHLAPPTNDCNIDQRAELASTLPLARSMVNHALSVMGRSPTPAIRAMLRKYFNDDSVSTQMHVIAGLQRLQRGLRTTVTYECENPGSFMYETFCGGSTAYVWKQPLGIDIHLCAAAFGRSNSALAETLIHENSHMFDFTDDEGYCSLVGGCPDDLSRWDAYDNADSFSTFCQDVFENLR